MSIISNEALAAHAGKPALDWIEHDAAEQAFGRWIIDAGAVLAAKRASEDRAAFEREVCGLVRETLERTLEAELIELAQTADLSTRKQYVSTFRRFKALCDEVGVSSMPASPEVVAAFLQGEYEAGASLPKLKGIVAAIAWVHDRYEKFDPTGDVLVRAVIRHATKYGKPSVRPSQEPDGG
jgi:hypothetical protein